MDVLKTFMDEIYSKAPMRNYPSYKIIYNHIDEIWSIDLADMIDYKTSNKKGFRYIFVIIDNFSENTWCIPLKNKYVETITKVVKNFNNIKTKDSQSRKWSR